MIDQSLEFDTVHTAVQFFGKTLNEKGEDVYVPIQISLEKAIIALNTMVHNLEQLKKENESDNSNNNSIDN